MSKRLLAGMFALLASGIFERAHAQVSKTDDSSHWPQWRGPLGTGESPSGKPPVTWSETENVRWKTPIPGRGLSSPIVWGDTIFVTSSIPIGEKLTPRMSGRPGEHDNRPIDSRHRFLVYAVQRSTGAIRWQKAVHEALPLEAGHQTASLASASPVTDGKRVYAHFGSHGLYAIDFDGNVVWQKSFGQMHSKHGHGEGASPAIADNTLVINWDHEEKSFLVTLDTETGDERWRRERNEDTSWSSPIVAEISGEKQIIVCGTNRVRGYSLATGDVIWECGGMSSNIVATPVYADGVLYVGSSYEKRILMAIRIDGARGDITDSDRILWSRTRGTPYVPSMLLYQKQLYFLTHYQNIMTRVTGRVGSDAPGTFRLGALGDIYSSPVAADGRVFISDLEGVTEVISAGDIPRTVAVNRLDEPISASLAIVGSEIIIRGEHHLYSIADSESEIEKVK